MNSEVQKSKILIAEDNLINQKLLTRLLQKISVDFTIVSNGEEAVIATQNEKYDIVFMDIHMPVMDGLEATQAIRKDNSSSADIKIIAMTANIMKEDYDKFMQIGMNDVITKPFTLDDFINMINQHSNKTPIPPRN
ncbi:MAG: response regulator [Ignavibacteria bacterium]|jgi:CheY-like chemotaxis protein|nr:response regulator [Ignavibacteria bacterium]